VDRIRRRDAVGEAKAQEATDGMTERGKHEREEQDAEGDTPSTISSAIAALACAFLISARVASSSEGTRSSGLLPFLSFILERRYEG
jgi:hypothetical protein